MAKLILSIFLALPAVIFTTKTHITVKTVKEELNIQNVEHPSDGVIVRIIDPPQEESEGHDVHEDGHEVAHGDDHGASEHGDHGEEHGEHEEHGTHGEHGDAHGEHGASTWRTW